MPRPEDIELPSKIPAIVLGGCTLFPHCLMPLFIFEQRYRDMLEYALESDRVFAVAAVPPGIDPDENPESILSITTAGLIRACVQHEDGTSHLMLQGLKRVRITDWDTSRSFRIGKCEPVECIDRDTDSTRVLANDLIDITTQLSGEGMPISERVQAHLRGVKCTSAVADVVAHNFVSDPLQRQVILETLNVPERLQLLHQHVHQIISGG
ncbi:LON peptidase substrate-binding domain-containing protein [Verrucomicrobiales bacterium]|nr:LON peptidase substrate-binding domain-containing protein [Verrucomicrobiales bacterium]MDC0321969.1 LON peptidase substrate-binding domain-containing protein [Verrucomicrobiales bacterium]